MRDAATHSKECTPAHGSRPLKAVTWTRILIALAVTAVALPVSFYTPEADSKPIVATASAYVMSAVLVVGFALAASAGLESDRGRDAPGLRFAGRALVLLATAIGIVLVGSSPLWWVPVSVDGRRHPDWPLWAFSMAFMMVALVAPSLWTAWRMTECLHPARPVGVTDGE